MDPKRKFRSVAVVIHTNLLPMMAVGLVVVLAGFYVRLWPLELIISQAPLLVVLATLILGLHVLTSVFMSLPARAVIVRQSLVFTLLLATWLQILSLQSVSSMVSTDSSSQVLRFSTYNKLYSNQQSTGAIDHLKAQQADIIALQEITAQEVLSYQQKLGFTHSATTSLGTSAAGSQIALISRFPIKTQTTIPLADGVAVLQAEIILPNDSLFAVYSVHIKPPFSPGAYSIGNTAFDALARQLSQETLPVLIAGDFNATVFSPKVQALQQDISDKITLVAEAKAPACSWYGHAYKLPLCMRIDHVLFDNSLKLTDLQIGPDTGSDHRIVTASFQL